MDKSIVMLFYAVPLILILVLYKFVLRVFFRDGDCAR
jgi:hypothetical protein